MSGSWLDYLRMIGQTGGALNGAGAFGAGMSGMPAPPDTSGLTTPPGGLAIQPGIGMPGPPISPSGGLGQPGVVPSGTPFPVQDSSGLTVDGAMARPYPYATVQPNAGLPATPRNIIKSSPSGPLSTGPAPVPPGYGGALPPARPVGQDGGPNAMVYIPPGGYAPAAPGAPPGAPPGADPTKPPPDWFHRNIVTPLDHLWNGTPKLDAAGKPVLDAAGKPVMEEAPKLTERQKALVGGASAIGAGLSKGAAPAATAPQIAAGGGGSVYKPAAYDAAKLGAARAAELAALRQRAQLQAPWLRRYQQQGLMGGGG